MFGIAFLETATTLPRASACAAWIVVTRLRWSIIGCNQNTLPRSG